MLASFAGQFGRVEPRQTATAFVTGLLSDIEVKTRFGDPDAVEFATKTEWERPCDVLLDRLIERRESS